MKQIKRITESDINRIVNKVVNEGFFDRFKKKTPEKMGDSPYYNSKQPIDFFENRMYPGIKFENRIGSSPVWIGDMIDRYPRFYVEQFKEGDFILTDFHSGDSGKETKKYKSTNSDKILEKVYNLIEEGKSNYDKKRRSFDVEL